MRYQLMNTERSFGLQWDNIAADKLHVDVNDYTIFLVSSDIDVINSYEDKDMVIGIDETEGVYSISQHNKQQLMVLPDNVCLVGMKNLKNNKKEIFGIVNLRKLA